jgi:hypothetical protein
MVQISGEGFRLCPAARRKIHVNPPAKRVLITRFNLGVADEPQAREGG